MPHQEGSLDILLFLGSVRPFRHAVRVGTFIQQMLHEHGHKVTIIGKFTENLNEWFFKKIQLFEIVSKIFLGGWFIESLSKLSLFGPQLLEQFFVPFNNYQPFLYSFALQSGVGKL